MGASPGKHLGLVGAHSSRWCQLKENKEDKGDKGDTRNSPTPVSLPLLLQGQECRIAQDVSAFALLIDTDGHCRALIVGFPLVSELVRAGLLI